MPSIIDLMEKTNGKVKYIFLTHESREKVEGHLARKEWDLPVYYYQYAPPEQIASSALPTTFVINSQGELIHQSKGMRNWNDDQALELLGIKPISE